MDAHILKILFISLVLSNPLFATESPKEKHEEHGEEDKHEDHGEDKDHEKHEEHKERGEHKENEEDHNHAKEKEHSEEGHHDEKEEGHEHGHDEGSNKFGPGKAILAVEDEGLRFRLSPDSLAFLKIKFENISHLVTMIEKKASKPAEPQFQIPKSAIAYFQAETSVYRLNKDWIEEIPIEIIKKEKDRIIVRSKKLQANDQIAISGVHFLRTAQLEASGQGGEGHAH